MAGIVIDRIAKSFGQATALEQISLDIADGEFIALLGPSGCGKTTLLRIMAGLEVQSAGRVLIGRRDVSRLKPAERGLAMVFQNYAVFPHMTVYDNVAFGLAMQKKPKDVIDRKVRQAAALLHIEPYLERYPAKLSGGQRQRVAVARALAVEPAVLLMDEPLSNLDALLRLEMRAELKSVLRRSGTTTVYVTHDQTEAMGLADRIAVMHGGRIVQIDDPTSVYRRPATQFVGGFVGSPPMNFLPVTASGGAVSLGGRAIPAPRDGQLLLGFRGEDVALAQPGEGLPCTIVVAEPMGSHLLLTGRCDGTILRIVAPAQAPIEAGQELGLVFDPSRVVWMDPSTGKSLQATAQETTSQEPNSLETTSRTRSTP
jgi:multiple sugar transport system ATP-binding protein